MQERSLYLRYYKRPEIQKAIVAAAQDREVAVQFGEKGFGKRPDILQHPNDILEFAKQGATSFHVSEEIWLNPLQLSTGMNRQDLDKLRKGWDLILDIDCHFLEYSKLAADLIIKALKYQGIISVSCKFSGNHGFHIAVPFSAFPESINGAPASQLFPEASRKIAEYLKAMIKNPLAEKIMKMERNFSDVVKKVGLPAEEITRFEKDEYGERIPKLNAEAFLAIDTVLISSRHLYRMPYSINDKSRLASVPIDPNSVLSFKREMADPLTLPISPFIFLDESKTIKNEARQLILQAYDFTAKQVEMHQHQKKEEREYEAFQEAAPLETFPPCIQKILAGIDDGKKRALFILINFLSSVGWNPEQMETLLEEWNKKNKEPLREVYWKGQLRYHKTHKKKVLPPNCSNDMYYKDLQIKCPDGICSKCKNPVNYVRKRTRFAKNESTEKKINDEN